MVAADAKTRGTCRWGRKAVKERFDTSDFAEIEIVEDDSLLAELEAMRSVAELHRLALKDAKTEIAVLESEVKNLRNILNEIYLLVKVDRIW